MKNKKCYKCGKVKPFSDFYVNRRMKGGYLNKCKTCTKAECADYRARNIEKVRAHDRIRARARAEEKAIYDRKYRKENREKIAERDRDYSQRYRQEHPEKVVVAKLKWRENHPGKETKISLKHRRKYPERIVAKEAVKIAVKSNKILKPTVCSRCGKEGVIINGHHEDYSKPLDVIWLCPGCHKEAHSIPTA